MKKNLVWFILIISVFFGMASCEKDNNNETDQRLINKKNKEAGELFLKENLKKEGIKTTADSTLQYRIDTIGKGERPLLTDSINVNYTGKLIDGTIFDSATEVDLLLSDMIPGFQEGVRLMKEGATHTLFIPYFLAYNTAQQTTVYNGKNVTIKPYSVLIFEVRLNEIVN